MYQVLGEVSFENDEGVHLPPRLRAFLALLLVSPGLAAGRQEVATCLRWGQRFDDRSYRKLVSDLRKTALPGVEVGHEEYRCKIDVDRQLVDFLRFEDACREAKAHPGEGRTALLRRALGEWSGEPLQGLAKYDFTRQRKRLLGMWRAAWLDLVRSELESGDYLSAQEETTGALAQWPGDESFRALLLEARQAWAEETGAARGEGHPDPAAAGSEVPTRSGQLRVPATAGRRRTARPGSPGAPWQVPAGRLRLIGRDEELAAIGRVLDPAADDAAKSRIVVLSGMPGVGKTELAITWAHTRRELYEGALYANLQGFTAPEAESTESVLARFLAALEVEPPTPTPEAMAAAYRSALAARSILVLLDNVRDSAQARPLLPGPGASAAVVTSRNRLDGLAVREGARQLVVGPLTRDECLDLLRSELDDERVTAEWQPAKDLVQHCAGLPLAVTVLAANARSRPSLRLWDFEKQIREERKRLDAFAHNEDDIDMRTVFGYSYARLSEEARKLLHRIACYPGPTIGSHTTTLLSTLDAGSTRRAIEELREASLLQEAEYERFSLHDLMRIFAMEMAEKHEADGLVQLIDDTLDYLLYSAFAADRQIVPGRDLPITDDPGIAAFRPRSAEEALSWFDAEYPALSAAVRRADAHGRRRHAWLLPVVTVTYQWRRRLYHDSRASLEVAVRSVEQVGSRADRAAVDRLLAGALRNLGKFTMAEARLKSALNHSEEADDALGSALAANNLGVVLRESSQAAQAAAYFTRALEGFSSLGDSLGTASALAGLGAVEFDTGQLEQARQSCAKALELFEAGDDRSGVGDTRRMLGRIHAAQGAVERAIAEFAAARDCYRRMGYPPREAETLCEVAELMAGAGRITEARSALADARDIYAELTISESDLSAIDDRLRQWANTLPGQTEEA